MKIIQSVLSCSKNGMMKTGKEKNHYIRISLSLYEFIISTLFEFVNSFSHCLLKYKLI